MLLLFIRCVVSIGWEIVFVINLFGCGLSALGVLKCSSDRWSGHILLRKILKGQTGNFYSNEVEVK
jgi:hypothetical protein